MKIDLKLEKAKCEHHYYILKQNVFICSNVYNNPETDNVNECMYVYTGVLSWTGNSGKIWRRPLPYKGPEYMVTI